MDGMKVIPVAIIRFKRAHDVPGHSMPEKIETNARTTIAFSPALRMFRVTGLAVTAKRGDQTITTPVFIPIENVAWWRPME